MYSPPDTSITLPPPSRPWRAPRCHPLTWHRPTPQLALPGGCCGYVVDYASGSGGTALTFTYTVDIGHNTSDLDYASTSALALNGGTIRDATGEADSEGPQRNGRTQIGHGYHA